MKKIFAALCVALFCGLWSADEATAQGPQYIYRIGLANKAGSPPLTNPAALLSPRTLSRRARLGIALDDADRPVSALYADTILQISGGRLHTTSRWRNEITILLPDSSSLPAIRAKSWVVAVENVGYYPGGLHAKTAPNSKWQTESGSPAPTALKSAASAAYYGDAWTQNHLVNGDALHDAGFTGTGMLIAVIDEPFQGADTHPGFAALRAGGRLTDTYNFVLRSPSNIYNGGSHGTSVLSNIAGFQPFTYVGAAPNADVALYVSENPASEQRVELDQMIAAMERADSIGADVVSVSLGYNTFDYPVGSDFLFSQLDGRTTSVAQAANLATAKGMLMVLTAGNEGASSWQKILTPGDADSALTVGSVASNGVSAINSGYGPNAAGRVKPDVSAMGQGAFVYNATGGITSGSGTSYATPQIAGFAACLWQAFPTKKPGEIRNAIVRSAHRFNNPDVQLGYGIPNFARALQVLGVKDAESDISGKVTAFYDPAQRHIRLWGDLSGPVALSLYDLSGRKISGNQVQFSGNGVTEWSPETPLPAGMYILHYQSQKERGALKLLVP